MNREKRENDSFSKTFFFGRNRILHFLFIVRNLFFVVSFCISSSSNSTSLIWKNDTSYPLSAGSIITIVGEDHCIYAFGGLINNGSTFTGSFKINITAGSPRGLLVGLLFVICISEN